MRIWVAQAMDALNTALAQIQHEWNDAPPKERKYLADASNLIERAHGKLKKAADHSPGGQD